MPSPRSIQEVLQLIVSSSSSSEVSGEIMLLREFVEFIAWRHIYVIA